MTQRTVGSRAIADQEVRKSRGHWHRESHARHRDYSPTLGRFIERDPIGFEAGDNNWYRFVANGPTGKTDPSGLSRLGVQLRDMYLTRAGLGALVIPQLFTGFYEWLADYEWSFQDDGTLENAQNSSRARHAFMIKLALDQNIPTDNAWHAVTVKTHDIFNTISRQQYDIVIREEPGVALLENASFWLGGLHEFRGKGSYEISMCKNGGTVTAQFRSMQLVWGWVDHVDAHSAIEYNWLVDSFGQGLVETTIGDIIGDKLLNGNYKAIIGFWERGDAGKYRYDLQSGEISASF